MLNKFNLDINKFKLIHHNKQNNTENYKSIILTNDAKKLIKNYSKKYCELFNYNI